MEPHALFTANTVFIPFQSPVAALEHMLRGEEIDISKHIITPYFKYIIP